MFPSFHVHRFLFVHTRIFSITLKCSLNLISPLILRRKLVFFSSTHSTTTWILPICSPWAKECSKEEFSSKSEKRKKCHQCTNVDYTCGSCYPPTFCLRIRLWTKVKLVYLGQFLKSKRVLSANFSVQNTKPHLSIMNMTDKFSMYVKWW